MTYTVNLYKNTGYNQSNIPDSPALLPPAFLTKTAIDSVQNRFLSIVKISATDFSEVQDADYCKVGDFYYFITGISMVAHDVAELKLQPDFINSIGGVSKLDIIDGMTVRHHVDDDGFGLYTEEDPLLVCQKPLVVDYGDFIFNNSSDGTTIITSTAALSTMGENQNFNAITYTDDDGNAVSVPHLEPNVLTTSFRIGDLISGQGETGHSFSISGVGCYDASKPTVKTGVQYCRDIAAESSIISQYLLPSDYANIYYFNDDATAGEISAVYGAINLNSCGISTKFADVNNNRVLYGDLCKFGMITVNGNRAEYAPERIVSPNQLGDSSANYTPYIGLAVDPRPDGSPYFRFDWIDSSQGIGENSSGNFKVNDQFWSGAIPGEQWYQVPLIFTGASGAEFANKYYNMQYSQNEYIHKKTEALNAFNLLSSGFNTVSNASGFASGSGATLLNLNRGSNQVAFQQGGINAQYGDGLINAGGGLLRSMASYDIEKANYDYNVGKNLYELGISQSVVVPTVMFPYSDGSIRDFIGNGVLAYRYRPSDEDVKNQDKILTMYGYRITEPLKASHFTNRKYFNYIQATGISFGNSIPHWYKAGLIQQLGNGVRIWHTTPSDSYYTNNPIAS